MHKIFKYAIELTDYVEIKMPINAQILKIDVQFGTVNMWALVNPNNNMEYRYFRIIGTGHPIYDISNLSYIDTLKMKNDNLVFHFFEERR